MKSRYKLAGEIDQWSKIISLEINRLKEKKPASSLLETLTPLRTNLGLLALFITGSVGDNEENKLIDQVIKGCDALKTTDLLIDFRQLEAMVREYQTEKANPRQTNPDTSNMIARFNAMTVQSAQRAKLFTSSGQLIESTRISEPTKDFGPARENQEEVSNSPRI